MCVYVDACSLRLTTIDRSIDCMHVYMRALSLYITCNYLNVAGRYMYICVHAHAMYRPAGIGILRTIDSRVAGAAPYEFRGVQMGPVIDPAVRQLKFSGILQHPFMYIYAESLHESQDRRVMSTRRTA